MCLALIDKKKPKSSGTGWKVFISHPNGLKGFDSFYGDARRPEGMWLKAEDGEFATTGFASHDSHNIGWHIYLNRDDASKLAQDYLDENPVIREVKYRGAHTSGLGDGYRNRGAKVVVAKELFILPEKKL